MFIESLRERLLIDSCCLSPSGKIVEIKNSERNEDLKKVWIDCNEADSVAVLDLEAKKNSSLCPLFRTPGDHLKVCDGIILIEKDGVNHAIFCEVKTSWDAGALRQIRNSHLFFEYIRSLAKAWHGATDSKVNMWFTIITAGRVPLLKYSTGFKMVSVPASARPSGKVDNPRRLVLTKGKKGCSSAHPLSLRDLADV